MNIYIHSYDNPDNPDDNPDDYIGESRNVGLRSTLSLSTAAIPMRVTPTKSDPSTRSQSANCYRIVTTDILG